MLTNDPITPQMQAYSSIEWIACDEDGCLGLFESGGYAPIPASILISESRRKRILNFFEEIDRSSGVIRHQEILEKIKIASPIASYFDGYDWWASRGVFAYSPITDSARIAPYERVVSPVTPIRVDQLPKEIAFTISLTRLRVRFADLQQIPLHVEISDNHTLPVQKL